MILLLIQARVMCNSDDSLLTKMKLTSLSKLKTGNFQSLKNTVSNIMQIYSFVINNWHVNIVSKSIPYFCDTTQIAPCVGAGELVA